MPRFQYTGLELISQFILSERLGPSPNAQHEAFTWVNHLGFSFTTTSPLEREMRELNRRADMGVRWSDKGIESVLKVLFHYRLNEQSVNPKEKT